MKFMWALVVVGSLISGMYTLEAIVEAQGAPQQAAGAAMAMLFVVVPYCLARAVEGMLAKKPATDPEAATCSACGGVLDRSLARKFCTHCGASLAH